MQLFRLRTAMRSRTPGFEQNDNSHWDKWFSDHVSVTNITATSTAFAGRRAMQIKLSNSASSSTISQFNQYGIPDNSIPVTAGALYSFGGWLKGGGVNRTTEHWWEWTADKDANTSARPALPWPEVFTPHMIVSNTPTAWSYANRVFTMPAGIPVIQFRHRYSVANPATGTLLTDNAFFRRLPNTQRHELDNARATRCGVALQHKRTAVAVGSARASTSTHGRRGRRSSAREAVRRTSPRDWPKENPPITFAATSS